MLHKPVDARDFHQNSASARRAHSRPIDAGFAHTLGTPSPADSSTAAHGLSCCAGRSVRGISIETRRAPHSARRAHSRPINAKFAHAPSERHPPRTIDRRAWPDVPRRPATAMSCRPGLLIFSGSNPKYDVNMRLAVVRRRVIHPLAGEPLSCEAQSLRSERADCGGAFIRARGAVSGHRKHQRNKSGFRPRVVPVRGWESSGRPIAERESWTFRRSEVTVTNRVANGSVGLVSIAWFPKKTIYIILS